MQIIELELSHLDLYCPVTGELICNEEMGYNEAAKSLKGYWIDEVFMEPFIKDASLNAAWAKLVSECEEAQEKAEEDDSELDEAYELDTNRLYRFLSDYDAPTWIVFQMANGAGGEVTNKGLFVVDMEKD